jgi:hypothetical protein
VSVRDRVAEPAVASDPVLYEVLESGVAVLTLNRPERMNGWGGGLATTFYSRLDDAEAEHDQQFDRRRRRRRGRLKGQEQ